jgi:peptidoglycan/xylan/chitin deacetylase (PgdA/CDA1 family)
MRALELTAAATVAAAALAATATVAALSPGSQLFGPTLIAGRDPAEVALTFDDGPNDACTEALLDLLDRANVKAAFFMIGAYVRQRPALARRVHAGGHIVANHTMTHPWLAWQTATRIRAELRGCNAVLEDALGAPVQYFRPPHGARRPAVLRIATELGLKTVQWNAMGGDWDPLPPAEIAARVQRDISRNRVRGQGSNILLHDGHQAAIGADRSRTVQATQLLLDGFQTNGQRVVTLDAWL